MTETKRATLVIFSISMLIPSSCLGEGSLAFGQYGNGAAAWSVTYNKKTKADAQSQALSECNQSGPNCILRTTFSNTCFALAVQVGSGYNGFGQGYGWTLQAAQTQAVQSCQQLGVICTVREAVCDNFSEDAQRLAEQAEYETYVQQLRQQAEDLKEQVSSLQQSASNADQMRINADNSAEQARQRNRDLEREAAALRQQAGRVKEQLSGLEQAVSNAKREQIVAERAAEELRRRSTILENEITEKIAEAKAQAVQIVLNARLAAGEIIRAASKPHTSKVESLWGMILLWWKGAQA